MLISSFLSSKLLILVGAACLFWIGLLSLAFMALSGLAVSSGWIMAGALVCATFAWMLVMFREIRDAVEIPDPFDSETSFNREMVEMESSEIFSEELGSAERWIPLQKPVRRRPRGARSGLIKVSSQSGSSEFFHPDV